MGVVSGWVGVVGGSRHEVSGWKDDQMVTPTNFLLQ